MKKLNLLWLLAIVFIGAATLVACGDPEDDDFGDEPEDEFGAQDPPTPGDETIPVFETMNWSEIDENGFRAILTIDDITELPAQKHDYAGWNSTAGVAVSDYPFDCEEIFASGVTLPGVGYSSTVDMGNVIVDGLLPGHIYYIRTWIEVTNGDRTERFCSQPVRVEMSKVSPFVEDMMRISASSIKDVTLRARLADGIHSEDALGGYEVEFLESEMTATYRKVSPEFETWEDTDTKQEGVAVNGELTIALHNLMPGQKVRIRPWLKIGQERFDGEWVEGKSASLATKGYVKIGAYQWAATNVGAGMPYETGTLFDSPKDVTVEDGEGEIPGDGPWGNIIKSKPERWVCGTLEGVEGWFVMDNTGSIFIPFTEKDDDGYSYGNYWGSNAINPGGFYQYFRCSNIPGLQTHQEYAPDLNDYPGKNPKPVRLVKPL